MAYYYQQWRITEFKLQKSEDDLSEIKAHQQVAATPIQMNKGRKKINIQASDILMASVKNGITFITTNTQYKSGFYQGTLTELQSLLPADIFFLARRNIIIRKETSQSLSSADFGKIELELKIEGEELLRSSSGREKHRVLENGWIAVAVQPKIDSDSLFKAHLSSSFPHLNTSLLKKY